VFQTTVKTVTKYPQSKLAKMLSSVCAGGEEDVVMTGEQEDLYSLDLDPQCFSTVLTWLRYDVVSPPPGLDLKLLLATAELLGLSELGREVSRQRKDPRGDMTDWLRLKVGGTMFEATRATLTSDCDSSLARMFQPDSSLAPATCSDGVYKIDACPRSFSVILNWLRYRSLALGEVKAEEVLPAVDYFGLRQLRSLLEIRIKKEKEEKSKLFHCIERSTVRMEDVFQRLESELSGVNEKMEELKVEFCQVVTGVEDIWRVKCEIASLTQCVSEALKKFKKT